MTTSTRTKYVERDSKDARQLAGLPEATRSYGTRGGSSQRQMPHRRNKAYIPARAEANVVDSSKVVKNSRSSCKSRYESHALLRE
jgi:hypothetical protein